MAGRDHLRAKGRTTPRVAGRMNGTETAFSHLLELERISGLIVRWRFEALKLRLADMTSYSPDFMTLRGDGSIHLYEIKPGNRAGPVWTPDSHVKAKLAAEAFGEFFFHVAWHYGKVWHVESIPKAG